MKQTPRKPPFPRLTRPCPILGGILLLALGVRLTALIELSVTPYFDFLLWDERIYHEWARKIAVGAYTSDQVYEFAPLYAYVLGFLYRLFSPEPIYARALNLGIGLAICWLVYHIGTTLANRRAGLWACLVAAIYKPLVLYSIVPLKTALATLCFAAAAWMLLRVLEDAATPVAPAGGAPRGLSNAGLFPALLLGISLGLLLNLRPNALVLIPLALVLAGWSMTRRRYAARQIAAVTGLILLGTLAALSPFVWRNYQAAGTLALATSQMGANLYLANHSGNPDPYYRPVPFATSSPFEQGIQFTIEASRRSGRPLSAGEASAYWTRETIREALAAPGTVARKMCRKALAAIHRFEACDHYDIEFLSRFIHLLRFPGVSFEVVLALAMAGMVRHFRDSRKIRAAALLLAVYASTLVVFFSNGRYRLPMVTLLIPLAVVGLEAMVAAVRGKEPCWVRRCLAVAVVFMVAGNLPLRATDDQSAYYNTHALILKKTGAIQEALDYWSLSDRMDRPFSAFARLALAAHFFERGDLKRGYAVLEKIPPDSFAAAQKYEMMGDLLESRGDREGAAACYDKSLGINSGQPRPLAKLARLHRDTDPARAARYREQLRYVASFYRLM